MEVVAGGTEGVTTKRLGGLRLFRVSFAALKTSPQSRHRERPVPRCNLRSGVLNCRSTCSEKKPMGPLESTVDPSKHPPDPEVSPSVPPKIAHNICVRLSKFLNRQNSESRLTSTHRTPHSKKRRHSQNCLFRQIYNSDRLPTLPFWATL